MLCGLDRTVAVFNVSVVLLDCFPSDPSRVSVMVVDICHHLCGDPHCPPVVDPQFRVQRRHDQEPNARRQAIAPLHQAVTIEHGMNRAFGGKWNVGEAAQQWRFYEFGPFPFSCFERFLRLQSIPKINGVIN
jgi:hypothetical protein